MPVNNHLMSRIATWKLWSQLATSSAKSKEFSTGKSLAVIGENRKFEYIINKYVGAFIASKKGRNFEVLFTTALFTSRLLYKMPGEVPTGQILRNCLFKISSSFLNTLKRFFSLLHLCLTQKALQLPF